MEDTKIYSDTEMLELVKKADPEKAGDVMASLLLDEDVKTYGMFDELVNDYVNGGDEYREGMRDAISNLLWKDGMQEICRLIEKDAMPDSE